jgi:flagellar hook-associated protein 2
MSNTVPGTNVAPVSFPGIASGIDYNSIITKLTSLTLAPTVTLNQQIASLNAANLELIKINGMLASVQGTLGAISQPGIFSSYNAISSNTTIATAQGLPSVTATAGTYTVQSVTIGTSTVVTGSTAVEHSELDTINAPPVAATTVPLSQSYAQVTPTNGSTGQGKVTVDGITINYDVTTQSLSTILSNIQTAVQAVDPTFTASLKAGTDTVEFKSTGAAITLGSAGDQGNLLTVLKLDTAQVNDTPTSGDVVGTSGVGGINQAATLNSTNSTGYATNAGYKTAVTAGNFTINGITISVNPAADNVADVITRINNSNAGVTAAFNQATGTITLTNKVAGPQSIVLSDGSSNFLSASGLTSGAGATVQAGTQAKVVLQNPSGTTQTIYSNSNQVTNAIPGIQLNILQTSATPFTVSVSQDTSQLVSSINTFVSAYNAAINEINQATQAPVVPTTPVGSLPGQNAGQYAGGVLYGNADVESLKQRLETLAANMMTTNGTSYNSLSSIGLTLDDSFTTLTAQSQSGTPSAGSTSGTGAIQTTTFQGTSGQFMPLNVSKLQAALAANPLAVQNLLQSTTGIIGTIGTYLTGITGEPTNFASGLLGNIPSISILQGFENSNTSTISSIQQQIKLITDNANQQADSLRREFSSTESTIAGLQSLQQQLGGFLKGNGG